jgi:hypothetical protein
MKMQINGLPVVDAKRKVTLKIIAKDIRNGNAKDPASCAAALACKRQLHANAARIHLGRSYVQIGRKWVRFLTPISLRTEIVSFDRGSSFKSGAFVLNPMQPSHRGSGKRQGSNVGKRGKDVKKRSTYRTLGLRPYGANR